MMEAWNEDEPQQPESSGLKLEALHALAFLTRLPIKIAAGTQLPPLSQAARAFPLAGLAAGLIAGLAGALAFTLGLPGPVAGALAVGAGILATGALHEDGLADMADGFWGGRDKAGKLAIMRDSRIGSYGVLALGLMLIIRVGLASTILQLQGGAALVALFAGAAAYSRALMVPLMAHVPPAREDGLSAMAGQPTADTARQAMVLGAGVAGVLFWATTGFGGALMGLLLGYAAARAVTRLARAHIGGQTGDVCGALSVAAEMASLAGAVMLLPTV